MVQDLPLNLQSLTIRSGNGQVMSLIRKFTVDGSEVVFAAVDLLRLQITNRPYTRPILVDS